MFSRVSLKLLFYDTCGGSCLGQVIYALPAFIKTSIENYKMAGEEGFAFGYGYISYHSKSKKEAISCETSSAESGRGE